MVEVRPAARRTLDVMSSTSADSRRSVVGMLPLTASVAANERVAGMGGSRGARAVGLRRGPVRHSPARTGGQRDGESAGRAVTRGGRVSRGGRAEREGVEAARAPLPHGTGGSAPGRAA